MSEKRTIERDTIVVFTSRYALSDGISRTEIEDTGLGYLWDRRLGRIYHLGKDCFETEEGARADAEKRRALKIANLKKQIAKLEKLEIKVRENV